MSEVLAFAAFEEGWLRASLELDQHVYKWGTKSITPKELNYCLVYGVT